MYYLEEFVNVDCIQKMLIYIIGFRIQQERVKQQELIENLLSEVYVPTKRYGNEWTSENIRWWQSTSVI